MVDMTSKNNSWRNVKTIFVNPTRNEVALIHLFDTNSSKLWQLARPLSPKEEKLLQKYYIEDLQIEAYGEEIPYLVILMTQMDETSGILALTEDGIIINDQVRLAKKVV